MLALELRAYLRAFDWQDLDLTACDIQDFLVRRAAFDFLRRETELRGEVLQWGVLSHGFVYQVRGFR